MAEKISGVYKITNTVTKDFYIGSSKDVKHRLAVHKCHSTWKNYPNKQLYQDINKYGVDSFVFEILAEVEAGSLKEMEQQFIEKLQPTYNSCNAKGLNVERYKEYHKQYQKTDKCKAYQKEYHKQYKKQYDNQLCCYNGETMTLKALSMRFKRKGITHSTIEAKKYLVL